LNLVLVSSGLIVHAGARSHAPIEHPMIERSRIASPSVATCRKNTSNADRPSSSERRLSRIANATNSDRRFAASPTSRAAGASIDFPLVSSLV